MENAVTKAREITNAMTNTLENFGFIVTALGKDVGINTVKRIENKLTPVMNGSGAIIKLRQMRVFGCI